MIRRHQSKAWRWATALAGILACVPVWALNDADVNRMQKACEAVREEALAPVRAQKTQSCIEQQLRSKGHCERYYQTYGNVAPSPSGAPQLGYFYDLPECRTWLEAREALRVGRSRP